MAAFCGHHGLCSTRLTVVLLVGAQKAFSVDGMDSGNDICCTAYLGRQVLLLNP